MCTQRRQNMRTPKTPEWFVPQARSPDFQPVKPAPDPHGTHVLVDFNFGSARKRIKPASEAGTDQKNE